MQFRLFTLAPLVLAAPLLAQTTTPPAAPVPRFEVSTIKRNLSGSGSSHSDFNNGLFTATNVQIKNLMEYSAYGIPQPRILGGPQWLDSERFDIEAKVDAGAVSRLKTLSRDQRKALLQSLFQQLLTDRFGLAIHWETRTLPVYALIPAKDGPKLHPASGSDRSVESNGSSTGNTLTAKDSTLGEFAETLTQELSHDLGRVILDKTGITGRYDFTLKWTSAENSDTASGAGPSVFTALQEQLGLKLNPAKGPVQVLVIDHISMPSEN